MHYLFSILLLITATLALTGCNQSSKKYDLKSPCASLDAPNSPCERRPLDNFIA